MNKLFLDSDLADLYRRIIPAIREVDRYHLIILEGGKFSSDFSMFDKPLSGNQMYGFHMYTWFGDNRKKGLDNLRNVTDAQNVPLWAGEFGENTYDMIGSTVKMYEDSANEINSGWCFWTWKKVPGKYPALMAITPSKNWINLMEWIDSPKSPKPDRTEALAGMKEFIQAARIENTQIDKQMLEALAKNMK